MFRCGKNIFRPTNIKNALSLFLILAFVFNFFLPAIHVHAETQTTLDVSSCCQDNYHYHQHEKVHHSNHSCLICQNLSYNFCDTTQSIELEYATNIFEEAILTLNNTLIKTYLLTSLQPQAP